MIKSCQEAELETYGQLPLGVVRNGGRWPAAAYNFSLVACARWETPYIVEWLSYHRSIGIDHIYLYCNDDSPEALFEQVLPFTQGVDPFVTFHHYSFQGLQFQIYYHFLRNYAHETKWLMFLDIDEFICIKSINNVPSFMRKFQSVDAVYFNWCSFGHSWHKTRPPGSVLLNYVNREKTATPFTKVFIKSKSVPMNEFFRWSQAPVMHDYICLNKALSVVNVLGEDLSWYYDDFPSKAWPYLLRDDNSNRILAEAFIAHYNIKSDEDFTLRVKRGLLGDYAAEKMWGEKDEQAKQLHHESTNAVRDVYLHDYWKQQIGSGWNSSVFPIMKWPLISQNCAATQSSTVHSVTVEQDAASIVSGKLSGKPQNHTELETDPWWAVDLGAPFVVHEMRVFNRLDGVLRRMARFELHSSEDGKKWTLRHRREDAAPFGGADGSPYRWIDQAGFPARWLRMTVPGPQQYLQLDQIQFFGLPSDPLTKRLMA